MARKKSTPMPEEVIKDESSEVKEKEVPSKENSNIWLGPGNAMYKGRVIRPGQEIPVD